LRLRLGDDLTERKTRSYGFEEAFGDGLALDFAAGLAVDFALGLADALAAAFGDALGAGEAAAIAAPVVTNAAARNDAIIFFKTDTSFVLNL
jgi:hypothetical protein